MNRTDGVPEMGDPFHDPNSGQKWAEFNTAEARHPSQAKVDLSKENQLWYYLGKTSTEARAQYTEDLAQTRYNTKSNFLDTVKPVPQIPPPGERRSFPASYPGKASGASAQRISNQHQNRPGGKPYQYKPKTDPYGRTQNPAYNYPLDPYRAPPHTPGEQQTNRPQDNKAGSPQYGNPYASSYHPVSRDSQPQQYHSHYSPSYPQPNNDRSALTEPRTDRYARSTMATYHSYYQATSSQLQRYSPPQYHDSYHQYNQQPAKTPTPQPQQPPTPKSQPTPPRRSAPIANMMGGTAAPSSKSPTMYATATSYSPSPTASFPHPSSQMNYLAHIQRYPYLLNAYCRRKKTYVSPYSPDGGFTPEWMPCAPATGTATTPSRAPSQQSGTGTGSSSSIYRPPQIGLGLNFGSAASIVPTSQVTAGAVPQRPGLMFQTAQQFQLDVARAPQQQVPGMPRFESLIKSLNTSAATSPTVVPAKLATDGQQQQKSSYGAEAGGGDSGAAMAEPPQRPIPSPLSDAPRSPRRPDYSPLSDSEAPSRPPLPVPAGETWRYS